MVRFYHSNVDDISKSDIVIIGVPDESKSHATRKGTSRGPDIIRIASNQSDFFKRNGKIIPICSMDGRRIDDKKIFDYGNINRLDLYHASL